MHKHVDTLPLVGLSRWHQIAPFVGVSRETWRKRCLEGRAPQPIQLTLRCTVWKNEEVHLWLADPIAFRAEQSVAHRVKSSEGDRSTSYAGMRNVVQDDLK